MPAKLISYTKEPYQVMTNAIAECRFTKWESIEHALNALRNCIKMGHESVLEHVQFTFRIHNVSRILTHQLVRHRLASYSQQSQRSVNQNNNNFIFPPSISKDSDRCSLYAVTIHRVFSAYDELISMGVPKEDARYILPGACDTSLIMSMNVRELRHFIKIRGNKPAQWEIRQLAKDILRILNDYIPICFEDITIEA